MSTFNKTSQPGTNKKNGTQPTLLSLFAQRVKEHPTQIWLTDLGDERSNSWTWEAANSEIQAVSSWINDALDGSGKNVSILSKNRAHWVLSDMAIIHSGHVSVPMFTTQSNEIAKYIFDFSDVKILFVGEADNWASIRDVIPKDARVVTYPGVEVDVSAIRWEDIVKEYSGRTVSVNPSPDDVISIVFTSGTTGMPKGVIQTHSSMILSVRRMDSRLGLDPKPRMISYLPLSHIAERIAIETHSLCLGGEISFAQSIATLFRDLQCITPTFFFGAPRIWETLQQEIYRCFGGRAAFEQAMAEDKAAATYKARTQLGFQNVDELISGSAPLSTSLLSFYDDLGMTIIEGFGQTEANSLFTNTKDDRRIGSIGKPNEGIDVRIAENSELQVRGPGFAVGYYNDPEKTSETFVDGWVHTGDRARVDDDGFYYITGRIKDYFKTIHGKFVAPGPIEDLFCQSPYLDQLCLIGRGCSKTAIICVPNSEGLALSKEELAQELTQTVESTNSALNERHARIGVVLLTREPWTIENGFLTTTLKVKRPAVDDAFLDIVKPLATEAAIHGEIRIEWNE
ncbi:MAG: AMP-binding protein [Parasphingorhabdus sp.]